MLMLYLHLSFFNYRLRIRPKCLVGVTGCDLRTNVLGNEVSMPLGLSPTAMQRMAHPDGELASARGKSSYVDSRIDFELIFNECRVMNIQNTLLFMLSIL